MGSLAGCMAIVDSLSDRDADSLLESVDRYIEAGLAPADAQRAAAVDFQAQVAADDAEARGAIREQFPELFRATEPAAPKKPRVFSDPAEQAAPAGAAPTYISRPVANATDLHAWAEAAGITDLVAPEDMHVTIAYSRQPFDAGQLPTAAASVAVAGGKRAVDVLGDEKAVVLRFDSPELQQRWQQTRDAGASWDYEGFKPHVTLSYTAQEVPAGIEPYRGALVLGPEKVEALDTGEAPLQSRAQTETPEFKRWFGDSKVVDEQGKPLVVYHGTTADFDAFKPGTGWFEADPGAANFWGGMNSAGARVVPAYLSIKRPLYMPASEVSTPRVMDALTRSDIDGVIVRESGQIRWAIVQDPEQIKSATGNRGTFDPSSADIRQSRSLEEDLQAQQQWLDGRAKDLGFENIEQLVDNDFDAFTRLAEQWREDHPAEVLLARPQGGFELPKFGVGSTLIEAIQDRYNRWKQTVDAVRKQGGNVTEASDFYRAEERYWGKVAARIEDFSAEVEAFTKQVAKDKLTMADVQLYAYAKHAKERNAYLRTKREANARTGFDSWSGMTDDEADEILQAAKDEGVEPQLERAHQALMKWTAGTRELMLDEGLITDAEFLTLEGAYDNYVPLKGAPGGDSKRKGSGTGSGFNIRGKETQKARGRYSMASDIIENIMQDRVRALTRAGKNEVLRSFLQFVLDNPDPNLWEVNAVQMKPVMTTDENGDQVIEEQAQVVKDDRTIAIKDGGREVYVLLKDEKLREQMKNLNAQQLGPVLGLLLAANRMLSMLYTALSPVFTVINFARDLGAAVPGMIQETGFVGSAKLVAGIPRALFQAYQAEFGAPGADYQLYRATGGKTGFMDYREIDQIAKDLQRQVRDAERSGFNPLWFMPASLRLVTRLNAGIENATRLAAFNAARSDGKSLAEAARIAKNITVNFNRKGAMTPHLSAYFLFFNPAVQGTTRVFQALQSPKVLATLGAGMTGVALLALQNASMGDDDDGVPWWDKIPQETKDRNLIIVLPAGAKEGEPVPGSKIGRYVKIPMPYGWNWFATIANQATDLWRHGQDPARGVRPAQAAKNVASSFLGAYMPVQELARSVDNSKSLLLAAVPDMLNPVGQALGNVNSFGRELYPSDEHSKHLPDASKMFPSQAGTIFQRTAKALNEGTGGSKYSSGVLDFTPGTIENLVRGYGGGPASFSLDLMNAWYVRQSIAREDLDANRLPFVKQLYGVIDAQAGQTIAYDRMEQISAAVDPIEAARRAGDRDIAKKMAAEAGPLYELGGKLLTVRKQLSDLRKREVDVISRDDPESVKYARLRQIDEQKSVVLQRLNEAYDAAMRSAAKKQP